MTDAHIEELHALIREYGTAVLCEGKVDLPRQINRIVSHFGSRTAPADSRPKVTLPPRVIDQLCQQAQVSTYHPDGDQQEKLHAYVAGVVDEVLARLKEGVAPENQTITLPPRAIDQIFQRAGVSTFHPDGDQLEKLHVLANLTMAETLARLPSEPAHDVHADSSGSDMSEAIHSGRISRLDSDLVRTRDRVEVARAAVGPAVSPVLESSLMPKDRVREIFMAHGFTIKDGETDLKAYVFAAADALLAAAEAVRSPEFLAKEAALLSPQSRAMLLNILWRHQGDSSPVGQPIRSLLGVGRHDHLTEDQVLMAQWVKGILDQAESGDPAVPVLKAYPLPGAESKPRSGSDVGTPWRVGIFDSSASPERQVRMLIEGEKDIAYAGGRSDFIAWICSGFGDSLAQALPANEAIRLTREQATAAIDDFEIIGENESSRDPTLEERYAIESYLDRLFEGSRPAISPIPA